MKDWIVSWLAEKTTWVGIVALASAFGAPHLVEGQETALVTLAASFFAMRDHACTPK